MQKTESSIRGLIWVECFLFLRNFKNNYFSRGIKMKWWSIQFDYSPFTSRPVSSVSPMWDNPATGWFPGRYNMVQSNLCNPTEEPETVRQRRTPSWKRKLSFSVAMGHALIIYIGVCIGIGKTGATNPVHGKKAAAAQPRDSNRDAQSEGSSLKSLMVSEKTIKVRASCPT